MASIPTISFDAIIIGGGGAVLRCNWLKAATRLP